MKTSLKKARSPGTTNGGGQIRLCTGGRNFVHVMAGIDTKSIFEKVINPFWALDRRTSKMTMKKNGSFIQSFRRFDWYGHHILVWPIAALQNDISTNQKGVFSVTCDAETGFKTPCSRFRNTGVGFRVWR
jgi:hypothetical protein